MTRGHRVDQLRARLLRFYHRHRRDLPWRRTRDPYAIWVSEIMLQQTQVETVKPRYEDFLRRFPTVQTLADAGEARVCEAWAGLGYYRRARHLHAAAVEVCDRHGGHLPETAAELLGLPGIGRYTSGAIASISFGEEAPVVDGNVARVLSRLHALAGPARAHEKTHWRLAAELVIGETPGDLNQALMELGATICTPKSPSCERCPLASACRAHAEGEPERYPAPKRSVEKKTITIAFAWLQTDRGLWLTQRPLTGLWPGLWEMPSETGRGAKRRLAERLGVELGRPITKIEHELTHRHVIATVYRARDPGRPRVTRSMKPYPEPLAAPLSGLARKTIRAISKM